MTIAVFGYEDGCDACSLLKELLTHHKIEYTFTEVERGNHPFKTVPQTFCGSQYCGDYTIWKKHLTPRG